MKKLLTAVPLLGISLFSGKVFAQDNTPSLFKGIKKEVFLLIRPRWEYVDIDNDGKKTANAGTVRAQLGFKLSKDAFSFYVENLLVATFADKYAPQRGGYELVPDEPRDRITQLWVSYKQSLFGTNLALKLGRQVINIDNQRFVGAVNWRQTPQTFDAARVDLKGEKFPFKPHLTVAYICDRQGVVSKLTTYNICGGGPISYSWVGHLGFSLPYGVKGAIYDYYFRKFADTYGLNLHGNFKVNMVNLNYWLEYALENVHNKVANVYDNSYYWHIKVGGSIKTDYGVPFVTLGFERLDKHFITPLATLHKFNGWADVFLKYTATSNNYGLNDYYASVGFKNRLIGKVMGVYHKFTATDDFQNGGDNFGDEWDLLYTRPLNIGKLKNLSFTLKFAKYNADDEAKNAGVGDKDTTKIWVMFTYKFHSTF